jgi:hypothetical protein
MKIAILTSVSGLNGARIADPLYKTHPNVDYYAFVDQPQHCNTWRQVPLPNFSTVDDIFKDRRNAKFPKLFGFLLIPHYDVYIWHDHYLEVIADPFQMAKDFLNDSEIAIFKHPKRNCIYEEMDAVLKFGFERPDLIQDSRKFFEEKNYPKDNGLYELTSFMYRNTFNVKQMMLSWWELINKFSSRDQISFPYVLQKQNLKHTIIPGSALSYGGSNQYIVEVREKQKY